MGSPNRFFVIFATGQKQLRTVGTIDELSLQEKSLANFPTGYTYFLNARVTL